MIETPPARKKIGVYGPRTPSHCQPDYFIDSDEARQRVDDGAARFIKNNYRNIRLFETDERSERRIAPFRSESASPGPATMERYIAAGTSSLNPQSESRSAINGWAPRRASQG